MPEQGLAKALSSAGLHWDRMCADSTEIVLFGSRAAGCAVAESDWDLLVIGQNPERRRVAGLVDIVSLREPAGSWLGTDLATHAAHFGIWLQGTPSWRSLVQFAAAAQRKEALLGRFARQLADYWPRLSLPRRLSHLRTMRLDAQRLLLLKRSQPIPPTRWLERDWKGTKREREQVLDLLTTLDAPSVLTATLWTEAAQPASSWQGHDQGM